MEPIIVELSPSLRSMIDTIMEKRELGLSNPAENEEAVRQVSHAMEYDAIEIRQLDRIRLLIGEMCDTSFYDDWEVGDPGPPGDIIDMTIDFLELVRDGKIL